MRKRKLSGYALKVLNKLNDGKVMQDVSGAVFTPSKTARELAASAPEMYVRTPTIESLEKRGLLQNTSRSRLRVFTLSKRGQQALETKIA